MLADDLLQQAYHLAALDPTRPKQASLRRAISTAYYSLFHLLVAESVRRISPAVPGKLGLRIARAFQHAEMKQHCRSIWTGNLSETLVELQPGGFSTELKDVARVFVLLQEARHHADYDLAKLYTRTQTIKLLDETQRAFQAWQGIKQSDEVNVFLAGLLFANRWSK